MREREHNSCRRSLIKLSQALGSLKSSSREESPSPSLCITCLLCPKVWLNRYRWVICCDSERSFSALKLGETSGTVQENNGVLISSLFCGSEKNPDDFPLHYKPSGLSLLPFPHGMHSQSPPAKWTGSTVHQCHLQNKNRDLCKEKTAVYAQKISKYFSGHANEGVKDRMHRKSRGLQSSWQSGQTKPRLYPSIHMSVQFRASWCSQRSPGSSTIWISYFRQPGFSFQDRSRSKEEWLYWGGRGRGGERKKDRQTPWEMSFVWFNAKFLGAVMQKQRREGKMREMTVWNREVYSVETLTEALYSFKMKSTLAEAFLSLSPIFLNNLLCTLIILCSHQPSELSPDDLNNSNFSNTFSKTSQMHKFKNKNRSQIIICIFPAAVHAK